MDYKISYERKAINKLKKIDKTQQKMIVSWIEKNIMGTNNPRNYGKPLNGKMKGFWRYRVGNYRIVADIKDNEVIILIVDIGHRRDIYD